MDSDSQTEPLLWKWRLPIAQDGWRFILPLAATALALFLIGWTTIAGLAAIATLLVVYFFRDPERKPPRIRGAIVSPADGRVTAIEEVQHEGFPDGRARRISIFLSIFNVHVNRSPVAARVESIEHRPGRFHNAIRDVSSRENERNRICLRNGSLALIVDQIAGIIARRVVCSCRTGEPVEQGERIGLIRFGSRVDTYLPLHAQVKVKKGMRVRGGESVLAIISSDLPDEQGS